MSNLQHEIGLLNRLPINQVAHSFLQGYIPERNDRLHLLSLLQVFILETCLSPSQKKGMPCEEEVRSAISFLERSEPKAAVKYLTCIGPNEVLTAEELDRAEDGHMATAAVLEVLRSQLMLGAVLPTPQQLS